MKNSKKILVTHNGSFHADDVFACAALSLMLQSENVNFEIVRTRDEDLIKKADYVFDVGGVYDAEQNRFDHHQVGGAGKRPVGNLEVEYSSFGLVWKKFGLELTNSEVAVKSVDKNLVAPIDAHDNGFTLVENRYEITPYLINNFIQVMRPTWNENPKDMETSFLKCVAVAKEILSREIIYVKDALEASQLVVATYNNTKDKRIIVLDKNYSYGDILEELPELFFVVYPRESDGFWAVKAARVKSKTFKNRKDLPNSWAGLRDLELQKITGVRDAVFCHRALFFAVAKSKEGAIKLAELAL